MIREKKNLHKLQIKLIPPDDGRLPMENEVIPGVIRKIKKAQKTRTKSKVKEKKSKTEKSVKKARQQNKKDKKSYKKSKKRSSKSKK